MTVATPLRTNEQRLEALANANLVRSRRAALKRELAEGEARLTDAMYSEEWWMASMRLQTLLLAVPKVGRVKADRVLLACGVSSGRTVAGATENQKERILDYFAQRYPVVST